MCLIVFSYQHHPDYRLVLAANRDEFLDRPTAPLGCYYPGMQILAGKDLRGGGTWLALAADGRLAAITNYRDHSRQRPDGPSRGEIIIDYLRSETSAVDFLADFAGRGERYSGFNLLLADSGTLAHYSNVSGITTLVAPGIHGLSNHLLNTPWPKVERAKSLLTPLLAGDRPLARDAVFAALADRQQPADDDLPDTGVDQEWERLLATVFIHGSDCGTRSSSLITIGSTGEAEFCERTYLHHQGGYRLAGEQCLRLSIGR